MTQFFGHFHPLLVHLPIGLILVLAILEWLTRYSRFKGANASARFILLLAVPLAAFTALCGYLLSLGSNYNDHLLQWHKWTGIGTAAACGIVGLCYLLEWKRLYRFFLFATVILLVVASHFGGSLTHGSDYLVRFAPQSLRALLGSTIKPEIKVKDVADLGVFHDIVQPMLQANCVGCHGSEKAESGLRLDSFETIIKGGKSGVVLVTNKSGESSLAKRLRLPLHQKEHMPPEGKPQPAPEEITWLQWWIDSGASPEAKVRQLRPSAKIVKTLQAHYGIKGSFVQKAKPLSEIQPLMATLSDTLGIALGTISPNEPWLQCNASIAGANFGDPELTQLAQLGSNLRWLDLAGTKVSDSGMAQISGMPNLVRLHLERTSLTDKGLEHLSRLPELEYLNLYGTQITDRGLTQLQLLPKLKQIYLWQTKVSPAAAKGFAESLTDDDQLQKWREEIEQINAKIKNERIVVDVGTPLVSTTNSGPLNAQCPVSGKVVDPTKTLLYEGGLIAFCCDDCREKFRRDPKAMNLVSKSLAETKPAKK